MRAFMLATIAIAIAAAGCGKTLRPGYCRTDSDCRGMGGGTCDTADRGGTFTCLEAGTPDAADGPDGGDGGDGDGGTDADASDAADGSSLCTNSVQCIGHDAGSVCEREAGACVECLPGSGTCAGTKPVCAGTTCVPCTKDSECNTSTMICMPDGHCAADGEVIFVEFKSAGCPGENGTAAMPFCTIAKAVMQLDAIKNVIVVRGAADDKLSLNTAGTSATIVGKPSASSAEASIPAGAGTAVTVTAGDIRIRDLTVKGATVAGSKGIVVSGSSTKLTLSNVKVATPTGLGVQADMGAQLTMDGCRIENNSGGGILIDGAAFDIRNTIVASNGPATFGIATWGGVLVNNPSASLKKLELLTVQNNNPVGVSCSAAVSGVGILASGNQGGEINPTCGFSSCGAATATCGAQP